MSAERAFFEAITTGMIPDESELHWISPRESMSRTFQLSIYAQMYFQRASEILSSDFPRLAALLGGEAWSKMLLAFLRAMPSKSHTLSARGSTLPGFLRAHPEWLSGFPAAADLADLENARAQVFLERDLAVLREGELRKIEPDALAEFRVRRVPASRLLRLEHDVENLLNSPRRHWMLIWRRQWSVYHAEIPAEEARALSVLESGATLGQAFDAFAGMQDPVAEAFRCLKTWIGEEILAGLESSVLHRHCLR